MDEAKATETARVERTPSYRVCVNGWLFREDAREVAKVLLRSNLPPGITVTIEPGDASMTDRWVEAVDRA